MDNLEELKLEFEYDLFYFFLVHNRKALKAYLTLKTIVNNTRTPYYAYKFWLDQLGQEIKHDFFYAMKLSKYDYV